MSQIKVITMQTVGNGTKTTEYVTKTKDVESFFYNVACDALLGSKLCLGTAVIIERTEYKMTIKSPKGERIFEASPTRKK